MPLASSLCFIPFVHITSPVRASSRMALDDGIDALHGEKKSWGKGAGGLPPSIDPFPIPASPETKLLPASRWTRGGKGGRALGLEESPAFGIRGALGSLKRDRKESASGSWFPGGRAVDGPRLAEGAPHPGDVLAHRPQPRGLALPQRLRPVAGTEGEGAPITTSLEYRRGPRFLRQMGGP